MFIAVLILTEIKNKSIYAKIRLLIFWIKSENM